LSSEGANLRGARKDKMANLDWMDTSDSAQREGARLLEKRLDRQQALVRSPCEIEIYQISHFQLGTGASGITPTTTVGLLGAALDNLEYGGTRSSSPLSKAMIYTNENKPVAEQTVASFYTRGVINDAIVYVIVLDEHTANGNSLNEIGLLVDNPFLKMETFLSPIGDPEGRSVVGTGGVGGVGNLPDFLGPGPNSDFTDTVHIGALSRDQPPSEEPGSLLAAYKQFPIIEKEDFFTLLFRWSITFAANCSEAND